MSFAVDANILLYAVNEDSLPHRAAKKFVEDRAQANEPWMMPWSVVHAFLRISTHPAILPRPLPPTRALEIMEDILERPHVMRLGEGDGFWERYSSDIRSLHLKGNALPDAQLAALLRTNGVTTLYTRDRDFLRFEGLKVVDPL